MPSKGHDLENLSTISERETVGSERKDTPQKPIAHGLINLLAMGVTFSRAQCASSNFCKILQAKCAGKWAKVVNLHRPRGTLSGNSYKANVSYRHFRVILYYGFKNFSFSAGIRVAGNRPVKIAMFVKLKRTVKCNGNRT